VLGRIVLTGMLAAAWGSGVLAQEAQVAFGDLRHDRDQPIEVTSEQLNVDQAAGTALFTGDVLAIQGDLRLSAERVLVHYVEDENQPGRIERIDAEGNVVLVLNDQAAEGDRGVYTLADGTVVMTGQVLLTQGQNTTSGEHLVVHLDTGTGTMTGGRVRTVLQPAESR
jgi:lipopolysaccharide export system protein LptA